MFIGGAPAGTAGGVKITTVAMLFFSVRSLMRGREETEAFGRRFSRNALARALCIFLLAIAFLFVGAMVMSLTERGTACGSMDFIDKMFELASALGTVGLTVGVTEVAGVTSRLVLCVLMYLGRAGLLTIALACGREDAESAIRYPLGEIMIG